MVMSMPTLRNPTREIHLTGDMWPHDIERLRDQYPELVYVFDRLGTLQDIEGETVSVDEYDELKEDLNAAEEHLASLKTQVHRSLEMIDTLQKMDAAKPVEDEIMQLYGVLKDITDARRAIDRAIEMTAPPPAPPPGSVSMQAVPTSSAPPAVPWPTPQKSPVTQADATNLRATAQYVHAQLEILEANARANGMLSDLQELIGVLEDALAKS